MLYTQVKDSLFILIYLAFWARFFFLIGEPINGNEGLSIYTHWRSAIDGVYWITDGLSMPVDWLFGVWQSLAPATVPEWLPTVRSNSLGLILQEPLGKVPPLQGMVTFLVGLPGIFDWLTPISVVFYRLLSPALDAFLDWARNVFWGLVVELTYTKKKQTKYQEALEKRAADMMKLNAEYHNLSREASKLKNTVVTDELTQVNNKRFFLNTIEETFKSAQDKQMLLTVVMIDIDFFKRLNDTYGHLLGDKVLIKVGELVRRHTPAGCYACRFGGEEFALIMPNLPLEQVKMVAETLHKAFPTLRFEEDATLKVTASFGVCHVNFKAPKAIELATHEQVIMMADEQLYKSKLNGRNQVTYITVV
jgi:diguanylate cyclase (GGDEF)-like protein